MTQKFQKDNSLKVILLTLGFVFILNACANNASAPSDEGQLPEYSAPATPWLKESFFEVQWPVTQTSLTISSAFGPRLKSTDNTYDFHRGLDIAGEKGEPVLAVASGQIVEVYDEGSSAFFLRGAW